MIRALILTACLVLTSGCGPGWLLDREGPPTTREPLEAEWESESDAPSEVPSEPAVEVEAEATTRCGRACLHIAKLAVTEVDRKGLTTWLDTCALRCERHGSSGQLDCYERSRDAQDVAACMTP